MGKTLVFLMLLLSNVAMAQFQDDFSDGNFTYNPAWVGNNALFSINANKQLQSVLNNTAQTITLATMQVNAINVKWEFTMQLNFDPSTTNLARIYLVANQQDLGGPLNGYFLQIGETGSTDSYDLYKQVGTTITKIIDGPAKTRLNANVVIAKVRVTRDDKGNWQLFTDITGGTNYVLEGTATNADIITSGYFGVYCKYTATRSDGFIFDNFSITELVPDVTPPILTAVKPLDANHLEVVFSEALENTSALMANNYNLSNGYGAPNSIDATAQANVFKLSFNSALPTGDYTLKVSDVRDLKGNIMNMGSTASFFFIKPYVAQKGDVVINEIFADPTPIFGLPNAEFVELYNTTDEYILLNGWKYADQTSTYTFGVDTLKPKSYLILCPNANLASFKVFGKTIGLASWPSLNNDKDVLKLSDATAKIIDQINYTNDWYKDEVKKDGGYSLELIDPKNKCTGIQNWMASNATIGGTPGEQNSVYQNQLSTIAPQLLTATIIDETTIRLVFSKYLDSLTASLATNYSINNGVGVAISASPIGPAFTTVDVKLNVPILRGTEHLLTVANVTDCAGNVIDASDNTAKLYLAKPIELNDILISEVLVNPKNSGVDYIEIYNNTADVLDLKDLQLANTDANGQIANIKAVSTTSVFMQPKTYWVLTTNPTVVQEQYMCKYPSQLLQMALPSYNNDKGTVILLNGEVTIDRFDYSEKMHVSLLKNVDGVALERTSFTKTANDIGNFTSATQAVGFGTPTDINSQQQLIDGDKIEVVLSSKTFSPDGDGFEDLLNIDYQLRAINNLATVKVYTDKGILVRKLQQNTTVPTLGRFVWDGLNDNGQIANVGIYVIKFDVFSPNGKTDRITKTCVLAGKF